MDETGLVGELAKLLGLSVRYLDVAPAPVLPAALDYVADWRAPLPSPNLHFNRVLARMAREDGVDVVLDGEGGDELFALAPFFLADLVRRGRVRQAYALTRRIPGFEGEPTWQQRRSVLVSYAVKGGLPPAARALARVLRPAEGRSARWLSEKSVRLLVDLDERWAWKRESEGPLWWRARVDDLFAQRNRVGVHDVLRRVRGAGLAAAHPLLDDLDLVEFVLRLPPRMLFDATFDRPLLRESVAGLIPDSIRLRSRKSYFDEVFVRSIEKDSQPIQTLLRAPDAMVGAHARLDVVRDFILDAPSDQRNSAWAWVLWRLVAAEVWLQGLEDTEAPRRLAEILYPGVAA
jgi:asparagine synthase (glutamine-hydrolysing)